MPTDGLDSAIVSISGWTDIVSSRQIVMAVVVLAVFLLSAPRGRRGLSWGIAPAFGAPRGGRHALGTLHAADAKDFLGCAPLLCHRIGFINRALGSGH